MTRDSAVSRRTMMKITGATAATALVAGCGGDDGDGNGNGNGNGNGDGDAIEIDPSETIEFEATTSDWTGLAPSSIEDESNPTLGLQEGETYEIGWTQGDSNEHNIEIRNSDGDVVDDYSTEPVMEEEPDDQMLTIDVTDEMATYVCDPHDTQMVGDIVLVEGSGGNGNGDENGDENSTENGDENSTE